ncbi:Oxidoreductase, short-chain dehydrogenase/reductase family [Taphrina deformans PYCC 5710]|uniref:2,4-dienoyl-CoA reductase [(3E)-enoyl-CoA-producing] n=1 Tax=Taphrina deformans (strain PYCC 5710 / ATCC 11124 / CBS 356.35 / IMI 108563 / JCM 9778 / NBRC 8474) TaxID=1097556 RepID=R4X985_TAPDE|nr:Oxidoreductase, short-chain dehydrogenase/reductase family [Taphrina deformans PYCC 5710]|eukprot:CCG81985.1 Oxidoreductase, short-chain dehydrogenase/reductase family [Taphrina deformans PYCC 5710]
MGSYKNETFKDNLFAGKVVFCTGGAGTICGRQVEALVQLGCNAVITGRNLEKTQSRAREMCNLRSGAKVIGLSADVRDVKAMEGAVATCVKELGSLDFLICGAAGNFLATIENLSANAFKTVMDIDVLGSYNTFKAAAPELKRSRGRVIFVSATLHYYGTPLQAHLSAAKAAIDALSQSIAVEYGPLGITSNIIAPGPIEGTEGMDRLLPKAQKDAMNKSIPLQRQGSTNDIADGTVYLFSPAAAWVTGQILIVDGGSWHTSRSSFPYPEIVLGQANLTDDVKQRKSNKGAKL